MEENVNEPLQYKNEDSIAKLREDACSDLDRGWSWVVLFASFGSFCLIGSTMNGVGIIHSTLLERFHESVSMTSWAGALHSAFILAGGPLSSALIDRFSCRVALIASGVSYTIGFLATAFAPNLEVTILTYGIVAGFGGACGYRSSIVVIAFNFRRMRNIALGIAVSGIGVGIFVIAPLMQLSRDYYGTSGFFIILAAISANIITFGVMCYPSKLEINIQIKRRNQAQQLKKVKAKSCASIRIYRNVGLNKAILCLCFSMFSYSIGTFLIYLHLPTYIVHKGFTYGEASVIVSFTGVFSVLGRVLTGAVANWERLNDMLLYSGTMGVVSLATFLFPLYSGSLAGQVAYAVILGLFFGSCYVVITAININFVGLNYMSAAIGLELFFGGIGALLGPVFAGIIVDYGGTYDQSLIVAACSILVASASGAAAVYFPGIDTQPQDTDIRKEYQKIIKVEVMCQRDTVLTTVSTREEMSNC